MHILALILVLILPSTYTYCTYTYYTYTFNYNYTYTSLDRTASLSLQSFKVILAPRGHSEITLVADPRQCGYAIQPTSVCLHTSPLTKRSTCCGTTVPHLASRLVSHFWEQRWTFRLYAVVADEMNPFSPSGPGEDRRDHGPWPSALTS